MLLIQCYLPISSFGASEDIIKPTDPAIQSFFSEAPRLTPEQAEGKHIHEIQIVRYPVAMEGDIWPLFLNKLRVVTQERVVRNYLEFTEGDLFETWFVEESIRNLKATSLFIEVLYFIRPHGEKGVDILLITRDIWSLKFPTVPIFGGGEGIVIAAQQENNFLGMNKQISLDQLVKATKEMNPDTGEYLLDSDGRPKTFLSLSLGASFSDRNFFKRRWVFYGEVMFHFDHRWDFQGWDTAIGMYRPLYSIKDIHGGGWRSNFIDTIVRQVDEYYLDLGSSTSLESGDIEQEPAIIYKARVFQFNGYYNHSWGEHLKFNLTNGVYFNFSDFSPHHEFNGLLPQDRLYWKFYTSGDLYRYDYKVLTNFYTYGINEYVPYGFNIHLAIHHSDKHLGSDATETFYGFSTVFQHIYWKDAMFRASLTYSLVVPENRYENPINKRFTINLRHYFPLLGIGRFNVQMGYMQTTASAFQTYIGGNPFYYNNREAYSMVATNMVILRGYRANYFEGYRVLYSNVEYRTLPLYVLSTYIGGVLFIDMAAPTRSRSAIFRKGDDIFQHTRFTTGIGIHLLFPQFNQGNLRIEVGFPLNPPPDYDYRFFFDNFTIGFFQLF